MKQRIWEWVKWVLKIKKCILVLLFSKKFLMDEANQIHQLLREMLTKMLQVVVWKKCKHKKVLMALSIKCKEIQWVNFHNKNCQISMTFNTEIEKTIIQFCKRHSRFNHSRTINNLMIICKTTDLVQKSP